ncbi:MAG: PilN domain-containing protein [bacterium]|nr:PilN domain-containing protein [bacterium]
MIKINLLPPEIIYKRKFKQQQKIAIMFILLYILIGFIMYTNKANEARILTNEISRGNELLARYETTVRKVEEIEAKKNNLNVKFSAINSLIKKAYIYPKFFEDFLATIPSGIWLTNMSFTDRGDSFELTMGVNASNYNTIADWIKNIENSGKFLEYEIGAISISETTEESRYSFPLRLIYKIQ